MRLLLSSWFLAPDQKPSVLPPSAGRARAGIVLNALDDLGASRDRDLARETRTLGAFGYSCEELDLRDYFGATDELHDRLGDLDLVWALGGNAFVLARAMTQSGFGEAVTLQLHDRPDFVYGGYSAGACVAGPDLDGIDLMDDRTVVPDRYSPTVQPLCLNLVPFRIVPHWRSQHRETNAAERAANYLAEAGLAHRRLRDGQVVTVHDGDMDFAD
jgi:dipeptidase E